MIRPNRNKALLKFEPEIKITAGGIHLQPAPYVGTEKQDFRIGDVLAIGPLDIDSKGREIPIEFEVGDRVIVTDYHTTTFGVKDVHFVEHPDVVAIIEKEAA